mmetsp:Transcript_177507/g.569308  ORF Transcript_177507/g.569308 Transcript_177507/m.569308 type:complete len:239 (+) Transcript_177507:432-1148(+)
MSLDQRLIVRVTRVWRGNCVVDAVELGLSRDFLRGVVHDDISTVVLHCVDVPGGAIRGDMGAHCFGDLHPHSPTTSAATEDQDARSLTNAALDQRLQGGQCHCWQCSGLLERKLGWFLGHLVCVCAGELGDRAPRAVTEDLIADLQHRHIGGHGLNDPSNIEADGPALHRAPHDRHARELVVDRVHGRRPHPDEHLAGPDLRLRDVPSLDQAPLGAAVVEHRAHRVEGGRLASATISI